MNVATTYKNALLKEGRDVLYEVTTRLYQGRRLRPDIYFENNPHLGKRKYNRVFNDSQRHFLEWNQSPNLYDINFTAKNFDVELHIALQRHACGIEQSHCSSLQGLREKINQFEELVDNRDSPYNLSASKNCIIDKLGELLQLYFGILQDLEEETGDDLTSVKQGIRRRMIQRKLAMNPDNSSETSEVWTTKQMVTAGAAGLGMGLAALGYLPPTAGTPYDNNSRTSGSRPTTSTSSEELTLAETMQLGMRNIQRGVSVYNALGSLFDSMKDDAA